MFGIVSKIKLFLLQVSWKIEYGNKNDLIPKSLFPIKTVVPGIHSYGELNIVTFNQGPKLYVGNYVSIARDVTFLLNGDHYTDHISSYPFKAKIIDPPESESLSKGDIIIEDDVWIGYGVKILSGVHIGQGAIVAAGAVVTTDVESYSIVGGVPAKILKYRFSSDIINKLQELDFSKLDESIINTYINELYETVNLETDLSWFPKKKIGE